MNWKKKGRGEKLGGCSISGELCRILGHDCRTASCCSSWPVLETPRRPIDKLQLNILPCRTHSRYLSPSSSFLPVSSAFLLAVISCSFETHPLRACIQISSVIQSHVYTYFPGSIPNVHRAPLNSMHPPHPCLKWRLMSKLIWLMILNNPASLHSGSVHSFYQSTALWSPTEPQFEKRNFIYTWRGRLLQMHWGL